MLLGVVLDRGLASGRALHDDAQDGRRRRDGRATRLRSGCRGGRHRRCRPRLFLPGAGGVSPPDGTASRRAPPARPRRTPAITGTPIGSDGGSPAARPSSGPEARPPGSRRQHRRPPERDPDDLPLPGGFRALRLPAPVCERERICAFGFTGASLGRGGRKAVQTGVDLRRSCAISAGAPGKPPAWRAIGLTPTARCR